MTTQTEIGIKNKGLLTLLDYSKEEIMQLLESALELKNSKENGEVIDWLKGKTLGMIFEKPSTRTRVSFEAGMTQLGGHAIYLDTKGSQLGRGETISDTARVMSEYVDAIMIRTFEHSKVEELAEAASIPVINGLTDDFHPCQALADLLTIYEVKQSLQGHKLVYVGDGNNVAHSLMIAAAKVGINCTVACPNGYEPDFEITKKAQLIGSETGAIIEISNDAMEAVNGADFIYTDVWTSMGQEEEQQKRLQALLPFQVNATLMDQADAHATFLHCLPAHRGEEVTADVIDGVQSAIFQQAGNRLHVQKALLVNLLT
ncbi:ornithine carbamoyltransferase [Bacillus solimangrovi]|uniref:Ornithine carbamoyltransferase n=1 Tax=Bacillus solimangrovi TaxID=1305675 RepID=A0A1E5LCB7_9BACI|nr:ornithine carbamoyltransferase [Bacillus solimangrovi]OEH91639.1 ornithine carbamoyltransferase [Bacillus solimangrovi]